MDRRPTGFTLIEMMVALVIIGILAAIATPLFFRMRERADEAVVRSNVHTVQLAVELYGTRNNGFYPANVNADVGFGSLIDALPGGVRLVNPFTDLADSPIDGAAGAMGEVGYQSHDGNGDGFTEGYVLTGFGANALVLQLDITN